MIKSIYLVGAGGYGKQLKVLLKKNKITNSVQFVDDKKNFNVQKFSKILKNVNFNISISAPLARENIYKLFCKKNFYYRTLSFSNKNIYTNKIGLGCIIEPNVIITSNVTVGKGNFIFFGTSIGHDSNIGNFCNLGCNVTISGNVTIGDRVQIGANSFISNGIKICSNTIISPGSVVLKDINNQGIYHGNIKIK